MIEKEKKFQIICYLSLVLFLCGVFIIVSSIIVGSDIAWKFGDDINMPAEFKMTNNVGLFFLWLSALIALAEGVLGIMLSKCQQKCFTMLYGSGLGLISLIVFIIGCTFAFQSSYMPKAVDTLCTSKNTQ